MHQKPLSARTHWGAYSTTTGPQPTVISRSRRLWWWQCRINYSSGGSPEPGPLNSGGLIISQKYFLYIPNIHKKLRQFTDQYTHLEICILKIISAVLEILDSWPNEYAVASDTETGLAGSEETALWLGFLLKYICFKISPIFIIFCQYF